MSRMLLSATGSRRPPRAKRAYFNAASASCASAATLHVGSWRRSRDPELTKSAGSRPQSSAFLSVAMTSLRLVGIGPVFRPQRFGPCAVVVGKRCDVVGKRCLCRQAICPRVSCGRLRSPDCGGAGAQTTGAARRSGGGVGQRGRRRAMLHAAGRQRWRRWPEPAVVALLRCGRVVG